jgi:RNA polymerase sigma-70 factor (ECF subfamily)
VRIDEEDLFDAHFRFHAAKVHAFALRRSDPELAQDVTAETFLIAWRRRADMPRQALPWLYGIARGVLANEHRAANRRGALASRLAAEARPLDPATDGDHEILRALAALSDTDREALLLCAWEDLSVKDAAAVVACSPATFAVRLHRARRRLARALALTAETDPVCPNAALPEVPG